MEFFYIFNGAGAFFVGLIIGVSNAYEGQKCFFCIVDLLILTYLCFFNPWWRNKIVGVFSKLPEEKYS